MSCPHSSAIGSTPERCSLCVQERQAVKVKRIAITPTGVLTENGISIGRFSDINREKQREETQLSHPGRRKTCGRCGKPGHNRATCSEAIEVVVDSEQDEYN